MVRILLIFIIFSNAKFEILEAQSCLPNGIAFISQGQIDSFEINYPDCTEILGDVTISGENINNLNGLSILNSINEDLIIKDNEALISLNGLENLTKVRHLRIEDNEALISLNGLNNLTDYHEYLLVANNPSLTSISALNSISSFDIFTIENNDALTSLNGLENMTSISEDFRIEGNQSLTSLDVLKNLKTVSDYFFIIGNPSLTSLSGLDSLTSSGLLWIGHNSSLSSLNGLENLVTVDAVLAFRSNPSLISLHGLESLVCVGDLKISNNDALTSLNGLENIEKIVCGEIDINENENLTSLTGLENIDYSTITSLYIYECPNLSICNIPPVCDYLETDNYEYIYENAFGCNNESQITASCLVPIKNINSNEIHIFPNPTYGIIQIEGDDLKNWELTIWNTAGILLKNHEFKERDQIDLSYLSSGLYFLEFRNEDQVVIEKVIKE